MDSGVDARNYGELKGLESARKPVSYTHLMKMSLTWGALYSVRGSRRGSNNFQDANEGRTSDSGNPSRCALSRS